MQKLYFIIDLKAHLVTRKGKVCYCSKDFRFKIRAMSNNFIIIGSCDVPQRASQLSPAMPVFSPRRRTTDWEAPGNHGGWAAAAASAGANKTAKQRQRGSPSLPLPCVRTRPRSWAPLKNYWISSKFFQDSFLFLKICQRQKEQQQDSPSATSAPVRALASLLPWVDRRLTNVPHQRGIPPQQYENSKVHLCKTTKRKERRDSRWSEAMKMFGNTNTNTI